MSRLPSTTTEISKKWRVGTVGIVAGYSILISQGSRHEPPRRVNTRIGNEAGYGYLPPTLSSWLKPVSRPTTKAFLYLHHMKCPTHRRLLHTARHPFVVDVPVCGQQPISYLPSSLTVRMKPGLNPPTDFSRTVTNLIADMTRKDGAIDQMRLRHCLGLAPSYLLLDTSTSVDGFRSWSTGFCQLVDVMAALEARGELQKETMDEASKACSECWGIAGTFRGMGYAREGVRVVALKLKGLLDENGRTYHGQTIYGGG